MLLPPMLFLTAVSAICYRQHPSLPATRTPRRAAASLSALPPPDYMSDAALKAELRARGQSAKALGDAQAAWRAVLIRHLLAARTDDAAAAQPAAGKERRPPTIEGAAARGAARGGASFSFLRPTPAAAPPVGGESPLAAPESLSERAIKAELDERGVAWRGRLQNCLGTFWEPSGPF